MMRKPRAQLMLYMELQVGHLERSERLCAKEVPSDVFSVGSEGNDVLLLYKVQHLMVFISSDLLLCL